ncbi:Mitochondrial import inner membrane translocase subunit Tim21 [Quillaja saponaria]|uniref:Mitochondrial import inner membrane translocase subunit Tim21 n=1 Tax=Quillaja saponaria TaxID=32244 RepID=A0AAD7VEC9_QUISA|nr:Mitochondrial import inner membrane translocase subunit Tim21 [Quillaja saponaria]
MKLLSVVRGYEYTPNRSLSYLTRSSQPAEVCWVDSKAKQDVLGAYGIPVIFRRQECTATFRSLYQFRENHGAKTITPFFARSISSRSSDQQGKNIRETKKDISTVDDPFDPLTYNIPEKPVTFAEGASYTVIILAGLGVAAAAGYAVFKELIFEPKEYKIFGKALKRIQDDGQVRVRIGYPITGYGQESRNRAARQRIPSRIWTDEDGVEHVEVNFYIRGPQGNGKVFCEMFKDKVDKQWKFTYLIVEIRSPVQKQMILESYMPAYSPEK